MMSPSLQHTDSVKTFFPQRDNSRVPSNHFYLLTFKNRHPNAMLICANCLSNIHRLAQVKLPAKRTSSRQHSTIPDAPARNASPQAIVINHANQKVHNQHEHHFANHFHGTFTPPQLKLERNYLNYYRRRASVGNRSLGLRTCQIGTCRLEVARTQATLAQRLQEVGQKVFIKQELHQANPIRSGCCRGSFRLRQC